MISPEEGTGEGLSVTETIARYNEPFLRERRIDAAHRELVAMSTEGDCHACAAPAAHAGQSLSLSNMAHTFFMSGRGTASKITTWQIMWSRV